MSYRGPGARAGQDRWLISYADLVTLLFACFTTAYAASVTQASESKATSQVEAAPAPTVIVPPVAQPPAASLRDVLAPALDAGLDGASIEIVEDARGLVLSLPDSAAFASGDAELTDAARDFLARVAGALSTTRASIRIEGHTDDVPVRGGAYRSNWELSTARASAVVVFMVTEAGFDPARLAAAGYGEFHPRTPNVDAESRGRNRRVDVVILDHAEPALEAVQ
jgi:chemotaxis protein MotB